MALLAANYLALDALNLGFTTPMVHFTIIQPFNALIPKPLHKPLQTWTSSTYKSPSMAKFLLPLLVAFFVAFQPQSAFSTTFNFHNNCPNTVWPGTLPGAGSPALAKTGFELAPGASDSLSAPASWSGRFWARLMCTTDASGRFQCASGDCGTGRIDCNGAGGSPPTSLIEFTLNGAGGKDFYDVSHVDGFNLPLSAAPQGQAGCSTADCLVDINGRCPEELKVRVNGMVTGCKSACLAFRKDEYCCTGEYNDPNKCQPSQYSKVFKDACPKAYSYPYDDKTSTFTCTSGGDYLITFCP